jgi:hypothetical protein
MTVSFFGFGGWLFSLAVPLWLLTGYRFQVNGVERANTALTLRVVVSYIQKITSLKADAS